MSYQTIVAAFDTAAHAEAAVQALKAGGFDADDISVFDKKRAALREPGPWQRLFGGGLNKYEADVYNQTLERGGFVVSVRVPDNEVAHATGILDLHRPIDVEDRAITTGIAPATRVEAAAAAIDEAAPIAAVQKVAVSPKLAQAYDDVLRLAEEQLEVGKRMVETGKTRVRRFVTERPVSANVTLHEEHAEVLRRAVTDPKYVGNVDWADTMVEVVETAEQALVNKTARVVEEVSLKKIGKDHVETIQDKVRRQQVEIERVPTEKPAVGAASVGAARRT
jgi:stress response protein YsnF